MTHQAFDLVPGLRDAVSRFAGENLDLLDPRMADGACQSAHWAFVEFLREGKFMIGWREADYVRGIDQIAAVTGPIRVEELHMVKRDRLEMLKREHMFDFFEPIHMLKRTYTSFERIAEEHSFYSSGCAWNNHVVTKIGQTCIDFTARQFRSALEAPWPLVFEVQGSVQDTRNA